MRKIIPALVLCVPLYAHADYGACILESVPGISSREVFFAAVRSCRDKYPEGLQGVDYGAGKGWIFSKYKNPDECLAAEARNTTLQIAVSEIRNVCRVMYGERPAPVAEPAPQKLIPHNGKMLTIDEFLNAPPEAPGR